MFKKVLFTTDGSQFAESALQVGIDFAKQCSAELRCVTVVENPIFYGIPEATALYDAEFYRSLATELEKLAQGAVDRVSQRAKAAGLAASGAIRHGAPADEVIAEANEWGADVIVTSTHGRTGLGRLLLGSTANRILTHAHCPVLLYRVAGER